MRGISDSPKHVTALIFIVCGLLLIPGNAAGAGGTCPSAANYLSTATNSLVTLSSLGVTNCYFIAANGSDTNNGTTEASPWLHSPGMPSCSGTCASVTPAAGMGFILRGGDTWHFGNSGLSPYTGGTLAWPSTGSSSNPIYIGVDQSWYSGSAWARPIFTADNPAASGIGTTVSGCTYQSGSANTLVNLAQGNDQIIFDNFEMTGLCQSDADTKQDRYIYYGSSGGLWLTNLYIHGWSHIAYSCSNDTGTCTNIMIFDGGGVNAPVPEHLWYDVVDGSDSDPGGAEVAKAGFGDVAYSVFRYACQIVRMQPHLWHDNLIEHWAGPGDQNDHPNLLEDEQTTAATSATYNSVFRHICTDTNFCPVSGMVGLWPYPKVGYTEYIFNNVMYDEAEIEYVNVGENGAGQDNGPLVIFNNTMEYNTSSSVIYSCASVATNPLTLANNHYIYDGSSPYSSGCASIETSGSPFTDLKMTHSTAASDGYTASETYAYSPSSTSNPTVGAGTNEGSSNGAFCSVLQTAANSDSTLQDAATACLSDTRYACTYNSTNHTVSCPARTTVTRPTSSNWDIGAYQSGDPVPPQPPTNVQATAH